MSTGTKIILPTDLNEDNVISLGSSYDRINGLPIYKTQIWDDMDAMKAYATSNTSGSYLGEILSLIDEGARNF